jgi:hypothetical protein
MRSPVIIGSAFVAKYPTGGGNFWVPLQYVHGLRDLGVDVHWLELVWGDGDAARARGFVESFRRQVAAAGIADRVTTVCYPDGGPQDPPGRAEQVGLSPQALRDRARDGVLLNVAHSVPRPYRDGFARTVLFDVDPGPFQIWARAHDLGVGSHDAYVTIGRNLGAPDSPVPLGDVPWQRVWPAVHLPSWPDVGATPGGRWTTVTQWWTGTWVVLDGEVLDGNKRTGFVALGDLPSRAGVPVELAANVHPGETEDRAWLAAHGWQLADPAVVAGSADAFRRYVQGSRGELSCAKPAYVRTRPGWISDRTVCYLASGRPCVVEDTGAAAHLRACDGLRFFRSADEAVAALRAIESDYAAASRAARAIAEEVFATRVVLPQLLAAAGAG